MPFQADISTDKIGGSASISGRKPRCTFPCLYVLAVFWSYRTYRGYDRVFGIAHIIELRRNTTHQQCAYFFAISLLIF